MNKYTELKNQIISDDTLIVPDAFNPISARMIEFCKFKAVQCSGYSFSVVQKHASEKNLTFDENILLTSQISNSVEIPVMADGEDGYADGSDFKENIRKFINTGIAGINIEDQNLWSTNCKEGIISINEAIQKIKMVIELKEELEIPDFILNARTDAIRYSDNRKLGIKASINRANHYLNSGADICFIPYVETLDEIKLLNTEINGPISIAAGLPYNINNFTLNDCKELGIGRVSLPSTLLYNSIQSMIKTLTDISITGELNQEEGFDFNILSDLLN